ncbi:MAG TPA: alpha-L-fucosidase [Pelobium sp.]
MKRLHLFLIFFLCTNVLFAQRFEYPKTNYVPTAGNLKNRAEFQDMKFGLFVHWGIYSLMGDGEWVMYNDKIPYKNYKKLADSFNPTQFDAKEWVAIAKAAGMKYITITARHHDGFSMFKSNASAYNIVDATPYKKDVIKQLAEECAKNGLKLHLYYSLLDWGRKDYGYGKPVKNAQPVDTDWNSYINFMKAQLTELLTNYPNIDAIWFDGEWEKPTANWHYNEIYQLIHKLRPQTLIGNNHHLAPIEGEDFQMFEKDLPGSNTAGFSKDATISNLPLETCETMNKNWGFAINDTAYKSTNAILKYLINAAGHNANFLLNVGPMANGKIQQEFVDTLKKVGEWTNKYGESIYGTRGNVIPTQPWGVATYKNNIIYAHILSAPTEKYIFLPGLKDKIKGAKMFEGKQSLKVKQQPEGVFIYLPVLDKNKVDNIVEIAI